jgi:hypothetical protein
MSSESFKSLKKNKIIVIKSYYFHEHEKNENFK